jgi:lipopolysaccharide export system protein LptC
VPVRFALAALTLTAACGAPSQDEGPPPPEVTLHEVRLRSYRGSTLTAVGRSESMSYERASADVLSGPGTLDVLSREAPSVTGHLPPATRIETRAARGNLLSRGIDVWGGVRLRTPSGLEGMTDKAHLDSLTMHASGTSPVEVHGPNGYWLRAQGFDLHLREDLYEFDRMQSRVSAL